MADWEAIFKRKGIVFQKPQEDMPKVVRFFKKNKVKLVLDLGCGTGRHSILLAKAGFDVFASDISQSGLNIARKRLNQKGLKASLKRFDCYKKFPFKKGFFDAIISVQVINHGFHKQIKKCIYEIERVLKPEGIIFITSTKSNYRTRATKFRKAAARTYIMLDGDEKGVPHFIYNKELLKKDFSNFNVLDLHIDSRKHYCLLGRLKKNSRK